MRHFDTGATRDDDTNKFDYEGFISPIVLERYAAYMHKHRKQADGKLRASDNWQKGIPISQYMKSFIRHTIDLWKAWRKADIEDMEELACAVLFNIQGLLFELLRETPPLQVDAEVEDLFESDASWPTQGDFERAGIDPKGGDKEYPVQRRCVVCGLLDGAHKMDCPQEGWQPKRTRLG
jgi:hypothetical protein